MSTAREIMAQQLEDQAKELNELRRRAGPKLPKLEEIAPGKVVSPQELRLLQEAQHLGKFDKFRGLREVILNDIGGRPIRHWFGNERAAWSPFEGDERRVRINRDAT
jgi:hypothetical protein